ncbi:MAG TPA: hypothetical protein VGK54_05805 [Chloroflexota bacterium]|jgi:hypothetical protein
MKTPIRGATRLIPFALVLLSSLASPVIASAQPIPWERWQHLEGVVDVGSPRSDGKLVVMAAGYLFLVSPVGSIEPFARGSDGFAGPADAEPYFVVAPVLPLAPDCIFRVDDVFILDVGYPSGVIRVDGAGRASHFATVQDVDSLYGIAFDTTGGFGYKLLVTGQHSGITTVAAVDCRGRVTIVTDSAPVVEGGVAVAPPGFGSFGGYLIAPDELSGLLWAIGPDGAASTVAVPDLPTGRDTGVESMGFVPPGFVSGRGFAYLADRGTPGNSFPGTDSLLRLPAAALAVAGVQDGDLLVATEGGGLTVAIHCDSICTSTQVAAGPSIGHIEGHIVFVPDR